MKHVHVVIFTELLADKADGYAYVAGRLVNNFRVGCVNDFNVEQAGVCQLVRCLIQLRSGLRDIVIVFCVTRKQFLNNKLGALGRNSDFAVIGYANLVCAAVAGNDGFGEIGGIRLIFRHGNITCLIIHRQCGTDGTHVSEKDT